MSRPAVSVVMPFAGDAEAARHAVATLLALDTGARDELIVSDNSGSVSAPAPVRVVSASGERSPAHARNVGAEHAQREWILFLDADCLAPPGLLDAYFAEPVAQDVGALAGEVAPAVEGATLAERYGAARSFLGQQAHLAHPYLPRAVAANLMVRRAAFERVGGFYEGVRAAEDTDFSWRLQRAGWRLELRPNARVRHRYRASLRELRAQWRGYAAGRAWLGRRYAGFTPEPAARRALSRALRRLTGGRGASRRTPQPATGASTADRARYLALDALLGIEELAGFALSNRPRARLASSDARQVVIVADRFPAPGDPLAEFARALDGARVEAAARPDALWVEVSRALEIRYREDEGTAARVHALLRLAMRHPLRAVRDAIGHGPGQPSLASLAPAALRLERQPNARVHPLGGPEAPRTARRLAALTGRTLTERR